MKYTIKQVLAFCDAIYKSEVEIAGGRDGYLVTPLNKHVSQVKRPAMEVIGFPIIMFMCLGAIGLNVGMLFIDGWNASSLAGIAILGSCIIFASNQNRKSKRFWSEAQEKFRSYAHWHEPEDLWETDYPRDNMARASLIRSVLGARIFNNRLMQMTAIPMDQKVVDARVAHLVKEIAASADTDIHPYLIEEVKSFCRQAVHDIDFYAPVITLQEELMKSD